MTKQEKRQRIGTPEKINILLWHVEHGSIYAKTAKHFGRDVGSIKKWEKIHPHLVSGEAQEKAIVKIRQKREEKKLTFEEKYYVGAELVMDEIYKRLITLIPQIESPGTLLDIADRFNPNALKGMEQPASGKNSEIRNQVQSHLEKLDEAFERIKKIQGEYTDFEDIKD
ncbi:MAG: hypothetical protein LBK58_05995 [Prevotellaceae bacterium]|jgi:hypothetical protein|nr:hypothetical protein [Prevotellaceae bacterium]